MLYLGAEWLVRGASGLASSLGVRPLVIGLTVVAYGTSAPELVVGVGAALSHKGSIAFGNSVGSNIANLGLILGITSIISPPKVDPDMRRRDLPVLVASTLAIPAVLVDGTISRLEAALLLAAALGYSALTLKNAKADPAKLTAVADAAEIAGAPAPKKPFGMVVVAVLGMAALVAGGKFFVDGATGIAHLLGMSDRLVGLTIVAIGTSVPELATSIIAARRGHSDVAVGNVVGSNIFNTFLILGASGTVGSIDQSLREVWLDLGALAVLTAIAVWALLAPRVTRRMGFVLLAGYATFLVALVLGPQAGP